MKCLKYLGSLIFNRLVGIIESTRRISMPENSNEKSNYYITSAGAGIRELPLEAISKNSDYFKALMKKAEAKIKAKKQEKQEK